jgi:predicted PurR-regulated permease PerM
VLISVLVGAKLAGILGALGAIPIAGAIQVVLLDWQRHRREGLVVSPAEPLPKRESPEIGKPDIGGSPDSL